MLTLESQCVLVLGRGVFYLRILPNHWRIKAGVTILSFMLSYLQVMFNYNNTISYCSMKWGSESKQTYILRTLFLFTFPFYSVILKLAKIILVSISFHTFWNIGVALKCQTQKLFVSQSLLLLFIFVFLFWHVKCPFISLHKFWFCWVSQKSVSIRQLILNFSSNKMDLRPRWETFSEELLCLRYHFLFLY